MRRVLMIAYHFPPINFSGIARPFYFAKHLSEFGYYPTVVAREGAGGHGTDFEPLAELNGRCEVHHVQPWDQDDWDAWVSRRFRLLDLPFRLVGLGDHVISEPFVWGHLRVWRGLAGDVHWVWPAVVSGLRLYRRHRFDIIWATGDPWTSLRAGYWLSRITGKPLVADMRDPWTYGPLWAPASRGHTAWHKRWERRIVNYAAHTVCTSPLTTEIMGRRTGRRAAKRMVTITNGFSGAERDPKRDVLNSKCLFCFVGHLFENHRNPDILFRGLQLACQDREIAKDACLQFIGGMAGFEADIHRYGLEKLVLCSGYVSQAESKRYMQGADVLVLLQTISGAGKDVISGKAYEYISAQRPILAVVPQDGGDAWLMRDTQSGLVVGVESAEQVAQGIRHYWCLWKEKKLDTVAQSVDIKRFSRWNLAGKLAALFDEILMRGR